MKYIGIILSLIAMLALIAGATFYLSNRFSIYFPAISKKVWLFTFIAVVITVLVGMIAFSTTANPIGKFVFMLGGTIAGILIFLLMAVAVSDLFSLIFKLSPQIRSLISISLALLLTIYGVWNAYAIKVKEITIPIQGLTHEIRAVHLTDVHLGNFRGEKSVEKIVRKIKEINPDVLFNTGDMFDSKVHFGTNEDVLSAFRTMNIPHYFVYGNHDEYVGLQTVVEQMKRADATVLQNEITHFNELQIIGLNNMLPDNNSFDPHATDTSQTIEKTLNKLEIKTDIPTIILHHRPDGVNYMQAKGADLLLAGHTHAGQIFPLTLIAKLMFGYNSGLYKYEDMAIYVSEGIGAIFAPVRLGTHSEMTLVKLVPQK